MEYPKIHSLWKRQGLYFDQEKKKSKDYQKGRQSFIIGDYAEPEFGNIKKWRVDEKVDGTNIRICFMKTTTGIFPPPIIGGRTCNAQLPTLLLTEIQKIFTWDSFAKAFPKILNENEEEKGFCIWLFGEGYGPKIQACGSNYRKDPGFILFDVKIGSWWLKKEDLNNIGEKFGISNTPELGIMTEKEIIEFVKSKPLSRCSMNPQMMEGVVCRSDPPMLFRNGNPIMWKLKCKEF